MDALQQTWNPDRYRKNAVFVSKLGEPVVDLLDPRQGEHVLDLGCGDGHLSEVLAARGCRVIGIDSSPEQVLAARDRGIDARVGDAAKLSFSREFDAVFSNAALHWVKDAEAAITGVAAALVPGGRFVGEFGGAGNVAAIVEATNANLASRGVDPEPLFPWFFPTPERYQTMLEDKGFVVESMELFPRPTALPNGLRAWFDTFGGIFTSAVRPEERDGFLAAIEADLAPVLRDAYGGGWHADYVRLRFRALIEGESR